MKPGENGHMARNGANGESCDTRPNLRGNRHRGGALSAAIGPAEQPGLPSQRDASQGPFGGIVGETHASIVQEEREAWLPASSTSMGPEKKESVEGVRDRSSRPHSSPSQTPPATCTAVETLRRQRHTGKQIATEVKVSPATVSRVLRRLGLNRMRDLEPAEPERRYERESPGEIIHIDIKKLGRFERVGHRISGDRSGPNKSRRAGWDFVHVCIDDHSRVAFSEIKPTRRRTALFPFSGQLWLITRASASLLRAS